MEGGREESEEVSREGGREGGREKGEEEGGHTIKLSHTPPSPSPQASTEVPAHPLLWRYISSMARK